MTKDNSEHYKKEKEHFEGGTLKKKTEEGYF